MGKIIFCIIAASIIAFILLLLLMDAGAEVDVDEKRGKK